MTEQKTETRQGERQRQRRLSPELNEFLHMLEALEDQLGSAQPASIRSRAA